MEKELNNFLSSPRVLYSLIALLCIILLLFSVDIYRNLTYKNPYDYEIDASEYANEYITCEGMSTKEKPTLDYGEKSDREVREFKRLFGVED